MSNKIKILDALGEAIGHTKGTIDGHLINIYSATEFYICGMRYPAGHYELRRVGDHKTADDEVIF